MKKLTLSNDSRIRLCGPNTYTVAYVLSNGSQLYIFLEDKLKNILANIRNLNNVLTVVQIYRL